MMDARDAGLPRYSSIYMLSCITSRFSLLLPVKSCAMIEIGKSIVSSDLLTSNFTCNLKACKGACCVMGDSGAPLEDDEVEITEGNISPVKALSQ